MTNAIDLLTTLYHEAEEAALRLGDGRHADTTLEYWKGRRDGIAYAIREMQQATGSFGGRDFIGRPQAKEALLLGAQLLEDFDRHRTVASDHERLD